jgi:hypothetical protein
MRNFCLCGLELLRQLILSISGLDSILTEHESQLILSISGLDFTLTEHESHLSGIIIYPPTSNLRPRNPT